MTKTKNSKGLAVSQFERLKTSDYLTFKFDMDSIETSNFLPLSKNEEDYAKTLSSPERQKSFFIAHSLLHTVLQKEFNIISAELLRKETGQWVLNNSPLHFSISHSGSMIFLGVSLHSIGVDVQEFSNNPPIHIAKKIFHINEIAFLEKQSKDKEPAIDFLSLFSLKEAYGKALGTGLTNIKEVDLSKYLRSKFKFMNFYEESCEISLEKSKNYIYSTFILRK